jgi:3-oxoacyl-[acyl-carrier protein] reductase
MPTRRSDRYIRGMNSFSDRNFLIVGGSSGIGWATARALSAAGAAVTIWSRSRPESDEGFPFDYAAVDVTVPLEEQGISIPSSLDGLVYAPGNINLGSFRQLKPETYQADFDLNVVGAVRVLQATQAALVAGDGASVVMFSTVAVGVGMQFHASVAAAKGALEGLSRSLAAEYAAKRVRFNVVAPSLTDTPLAARLLSNEQKREASAQRHPLGRVGTADDIAAAALFLLDPANSWITGQTIGVDGGLSRISGL